jgi:hypothetical protein
VKIGEVITHRGRRYVVVGLTPMSVRPFCLELEDEETGEAISLEWPPADEVERAALRVVSDSSVDAEPR